MDGLVQFGVQTSVDYPKVIMYCDKRDNLSRYRNISMIFRYDKDATLDYDPT